MSKPHPAEEEATLPWLDQWHLFFTHLLLQRTQPANFLYPRPGKQAQLLSVFFRYWSADRWGRTIPPDEAVPAPAVMRLVFALAQLIPAWHLFPESFQTEMETLFQGLLYLAEDRLLKLAQTELRVARQIRGEPVPPDELPALPIDVSTLPDVDLDRLARAIELQRALREMRRPRNVPETG